MSGTTACRAFLIPGIAWLSTCYFTLTFLVTRQTIFYAKLAMLRIARQIKKTRGGVKCGMVPPALVLSMKTWTAFILVATVHQSAAFASRAITSVRQHAKTPTLVAINMAVKEATFGMGCFWEPAESLLKRPGILATNVGYAGAPPGKPPPTYDTVCFGNDWVEAVRVAYDDEALTYRELLDYFFEYQKPGYKRQYASVIFAGDQSEAKEAKRWKEERSKERSKEDVMTQRKDGVSYDIIEIEPNSSFYRAEEYHQRYWEKQRLRGLLAVILIAGESGVYNKYVERFVGLSNVELVFGMSFDGVCGAVFLAGAAWMLIERLVARNVRELKPGDLIAAVAKQK